MVHFPKKIEVDDPRLNVLHKFCVLVFVVVFTIIVLLMRMYDEDVPVGERIWTSIEIPAVTEAGYTVLRRGFENMANRSVCQSPGDFDFWWDAGGVYQYSDYSCLDLCDSQEAAQRCISRYEIVQAKDDRSFMLVTEVEDSPAASHLYPDYFFVAWEPETLFVHLYYGTITQDRSWFGPAKGKASDEHHSSTTDIQTVIMDYKGEVQEIVDPSPRVVMSMANIIKWSGPNIGLESEVPGGDPNYMPGAKTKSVIPRISGGNIKAALRCFTKPSGAYSWSKGPVCELQFEYYAGPWAGDPFIRSVSTNGTKVGSYYHGLRIKLFPGGFFSYPTISRMYKVLVDLFVLSVWPVFCVLAVASFLLGQNSKIYEQAIHQEFDIMTECKGTIARLLTYSLDFQIFRDEERNDVSRLVIAERLSAAMHQHRTTIDHHELLALVYFCHDAMLKSSTGGSSYCQSLCEDITQGLGTLLPSRLERQANTFHKKKRQAGVTVSQFNSCCCNDEAIQFHDLVGLFDRDRHRTRLEKLFCLSDAEVLAFRDASEWLFDEESVEVQNLVLGHHNVKEAARMSKRLSALEQYFRESSKPGELAVRNVGSVEHISTRSSQKAQKLNKYTEKHGEEMRADADLFDRDGDGAIDEGELRKVVWRESPGFIAAQHDMFTARMTISEAKRKLKELQSRGCKGFCHTGPKNPPGAVMCHFRNSSEITPSKNDPWSSYVLDVVQERDDLVAAFKMFDRDGNNVVSLAEMTSLMTTMSGTCLHVHDTKGPSSKEIPTDKAAWKEACDAYIVEAINESRFPSATSSAREEKKKRALAWIESIHKLGLCPCTRKKHDENCGIELKKKIMDKLETHTETIMFYTSCFQFRTLVEAEKSKYQLRKTLDRISVGEGEEKTIRQIIFHYSDKTERTFGINAGSNTHIFEMQTSQGEYLKEIHFSSRKRLQSYDMCSLEFVTNWNRRSRTYGDLDLGNHDCTKVAAMPFRQIFSLPEGDQACELKPINQVETRLSAIEAGVRMSKTDDKGNIETLSFLIEGTSLILYIQDAQVETYCDNPRQTGTMKVRCIVNEIAFTEGKTPAATIYVKVTEVKWLERKLSEGTVDPARDMEARQSFTFAGLKWTDIGDLKEIADAISIDNDLPEVILDTRPMTDGEVQELLTELDADGDGMVNYEEFISILRGSTTSNAIIEGDKKKKKRTQFLSGEEMTV